MKSNITEIFPKISALTLFTNEEIQSREDIFETSNKFKILHLKSNINLYTTKIKKASNQDLNFCTNIDKLFYLSKFTLKEIDEYNTYTYEKYKTNRHINLLLLLTRIPDNKLKTLISENNDIDGYICKTTIYPYNLEIWLKNENILEYCKHFTEIKPNNIINEDINIISNNKIGEWIYEDI